MGIIIKDTIKLLNGEFIKNAYGSFDNNKLSIKYKDGYYKLSGIGFIWKNFKDRRYTPPLIFLKIEIYNINNSEAYEKYKILYEEWKKIYKNTIDI
jgi:hypothetical protein